MRFAFPMSMGLCLLAGGAPTARAAPLDTALIEQITTMPGVFDTNEGVFKISVPREDLQVSVDGQPLPPFMGLNSQVAFTAGKNGNSLIMGDIVLFQDEVNPAISAALTNGLSVTALSSRFVFDEPKVYFMHINGSGDLKKLALGFNSVLDAIRKTRTANPNLAVTFGGLPPPGRNAITGAVIEHILGAKGRTQDGMFKVVIGRTTTVSGIKIGGDMGVNSWAVFSGVDDNATVDGDFAVHEDELQGVLKALLKGGIYITAINNQMTDETPRMLFVSYWGKGDIKDLAKTLKTALDAQGG